jgi:hypothetical protein
MKPIIYLYFHSKILNWKGKRVSDKEFKSCLFQWRIPKNLRDPIMREMEKLGLIKTEKRQVELQDFYLKENKKKIDFKDKDTKKENPYINYINL